MLVRLDLVFRDPELAAKTIRLFCNGAIWTSFQASLRNIASTSSGLVRKSLVSTLTTVYPRDSR